jgi:formylglycine-generating enzyme required for sulfatase activity
MYSDRRGFRLPLEAEWEVACRGEMRTAYGFGGDPTLLRYYAWFWDNMGDGSGVYRPRQLRPNLRGLFDMHGNVYEWCHDVYSDSEPIQPDVREAPVSVSFRVTRGGWKMARAEVCRSAYRSRFDPKTRSGNLGFRLALTLPE